MQGKHASKMHLGTALFLLLTLQAFRLVSTQTTNSENGDLSPLPFNGISDEWKRENGVTLHEEDLRISSGSMAFSEDDEYRAGNQTVRAVTEQYDTISTTLSPQTTMNVSSNTTETNTTSIQQNDTINSVTENPTLEPATTTSSSHVNLRETNTTTTSPGNSTSTATTTTTTTNTTNNATTATSTTAFNITQNSKSTVSENFITTSSPPVTNYTSSRENSTNTTISTTTTIQTSVSTTAMNITGGSFNSRGNMDRGLTSDIQQQGKSQAWGAILGIGVGVAIIALVIYVIVKRRNYSDFSHRKLVEDVPHEPVLRLDNSEPLDLKFDGFAYYNPGLQGDNIQMTNFPKGQTK